MFNGDNGSWLVMALTTVLSIFVFAQVYNGFLAIGHPDTEPYIISGKMNMRFGTFMKIAASATWLGDFVTAWMVRLSSKNLCVGSTEKQCFFCQKAPLWCISTFY